MEMIVGNAYNWKDQPERLIYLGRNWSGNGYWHQFKKIDDPREVWCEVLDSDLDAIEPTALNGIEPITAESVSETNAMREVLIRLLQWDHFDAAGDGPFWRQQINAALAPVPRGLAE